MKKNLLIFILVFSFALLFSAPVFAYTYSRTPAGYNSYNPVNFSFSSVSQEEIANLCGTDWITSWRIQILKLPDQQEFYTEWVFLPVLSGNSSMTLPFGEYLKVSLKCRKNFLTFDGQIFEYNGGTAVFEVKPPPQIFGYNSDFNTNFSASVFNFGSQLLADLRVVLYILIGLALGMGIIIFILNFFEDRKTK